MAGFWESVLPGGLGAYGYAKQMQNVDRDMNRVQDDIEGLQQGVDERTQFQPWGVTGGMGTVGSDGQGNFSYNLSDQMQGRQDADWARSDIMADRSMQDMQGREQQVYDRMMSIMQPGQDRNTMTMQNRLANQGRTGIRSNAFGGSPEELANAMAQGEIENRAMMTAMNQGMAEQLQNYNMAQGYGQSGYDPLNALMGTGKMGMADAEMQQRGQLSGADMWTQLGLGGVTADQNFRNIQANMFGDMIGAGSNMLGGIGAGMDGTDWGSVWDSISGIWS